MDDMNETTTDPGTPPGNPADQPAGQTYGQQTPPPPHQDLDRLRRSTSDRYIAGVAGGIGRHFGIDPTIIRVLLAVLTFFGGAGVVIYGVCWLFVPEDGDERAAIHVGSEPRKLLLLAAAAIAFLLAMGDAFSGFDSGWWIASLAVVVSAVLIARDRTDDRKASRAAQAQAWAAHREAVANGGTPAYAQTYAQTPVPAPTQAPDATYAGAPASAFAAGDTQTLQPSSPPAPPAWQPPQPPLVPPRPKRTGIIWFWPTLALIAIALGTLGILDTNSSNIEAWAYPATAVAITGVMLLVGSFVGRPGGLIFLGFVSSFALAVATVVGGFNFDGRTIEEAPTTAAAVQSEYTANNGRIELDLTQVADQNGLYGRTIELSLKAGEIVVIVPRSLNVHIDAEFEFAGGIKVPGYDGGGIQDSVERNLVGLPMNPGPPLDLEIDATVGQITVEQR